MSWFSWGKKKSEKANPTTKQSEVEAAYEKMLPPPELNPELEERQPGEDPDDLEDRDEEDHGPDADEVPEDREDEDLSHLHYDEWCDLLSTMAEDLNRAAVRRAPVDDIVELLEEAEAIVPSLREAYPRRLTSAN